MAGFRQLTGAEDSSIATQVAWQLAQRALTTSLERQHANPGPEAEP